MSKYNFVFYNQILDKKGTKKILSWFLDQYGPTRTSQFLEELKTIGFHFETLTGLSLGFDDLKIPSKKSLLLKTAEIQIQACEQGFQQGKLTAVERYQKVITLWTTASENLKDEVIQYFQSTDLFNPLYMMAFSGARGNISQVRQLVGMRGLMSDSGGGIIDFPIRRNFREGLTVTEYAISCYGARKGLIDTALRTADSGYLTRRLVDVAHGIMIGRTDCGTDEGFPILPLQTKGFGKSSVLLSLEKRILGRVLAQGIPQVAQKNQEITPVLAHEIGQIVHTKAKASLKNNAASLDHQMKRIRSEATCKSLISLDLIPSFDTGVLIRSPLTCKHFQNFREDICQLCYGWSLAQARLVSLGEAVGILAAQSIGEPGTQLTMRTFHTGGIFSTDIEAKIFAPHSGTVFYGWGSKKKGKKIRTLDGQTGFFLFESLQLKIQASAKLMHEDTNNVHPFESIFFLPAQSIIFVYPGQQINKNTLCAEISNFQQSDPYRTHARVVNQNRSDSELARFHETAQKNEPSLSPLNTSGSQSILPQTQKLIQNQNGETHNGLNFNQAETKSIEFELSEYGEHFHLDSKISSEDTPLSGAWLGKSMDNSESIEEPTEGNIQTKKVLSEIEGQVYFTNFSSVRSGVFWVLSGFGISFHRTIKNGDFYCSRPQKKTTPETFSPPLKMSSAHSLISSKNKTDLRSRSRGDHNLSYDMTSGIPSHARVWTFCRSTPPGPSSNVQLPFCLFSDPTYFISKSVQSMKLKKNFWDSFFCFSEKKGSFVSKNRIRKREKQKIPDTMKIIRGLIWHKIKYQQNSLADSQLSTKDMISVASRSSQENHRSSILGEIRGIQSKQVANLGLNDILRIPAQLTNSLQDQEKLLCIYKKHLRVLTLPQTQNKNSDLSGSSPDFQTNSPLGNFIGATESLNFLSQKNDIHELGRPLNKTIALFQNVNLDKSVHILMHTSKKYAGRSHLTTDLVRDEQNLKAVISKPGMIHPLRAKLSMTDLTQELFVVRRIHPYLISDQSTVHARHGDIVGSRQLLFELFFEKSKTGDIVQGLPKIEQLFEARRTSLHVQETIHKKLKEKYLEFSNQYSCFEATARSIRYIQRILVDEIQSVYQSQGVDIADKHIEIIVRQMTSKVILHESRFGPIETPFFPGDIVDFYKIADAQSEYERSRNQGSLQMMSKLDSKTSEVIEPLVLGITKVAFLTESFISAASFQEAKRVLMYAALESRVDFLYGLKENVIVGRFIRAGTGFQVNVFPNY